MLCFFLKFHTLYSSLCKSTTSLFQIRMDRIFSTTSQIQCTFFFKVWCHKDLWFLMEYETHSVAHSKYTLDLYSQFLWRKWMAFFNITVEFYWALFFTLSLSLCRCKTLVEKIKVSSRSADTHTNRNKRKTHIRIVCMALSC